MSLYSLTGSIQQTGIDPLTGDPIMVLALANQGVAYELHITQRTLQKLPTSNKTNTSELEIFVYQHIRPEEQRLVGFLTRPERELFRLLMGANGVGLKMALSILDALPLTDLIQAILSENYKTLTVAKGVGNKLAQKMILDLKEKLALWQERLLTHGGSEVHQALMGENAQNAIDVANHFAQQPLTEAEQVLLSLGYEASEVYTALKALCAVSVPEETLTYNSEGLLKAILKQLH